MKRTQPELLLRAYQLGWTIKEIGDAFGLSRYVVRNRLTRMGAPLASKGGYRANEVASGTELVK